MKADIEIARECSLRPVVEIAARLGIPPQQLVPYGHTKAKVSLDYVESLQDRPDGKLVLVTAMSPTPAGRGQDHPGHRPGRCHESPGREGLRLLCGSPASARASDSRVAPPAAAMPRWCRWRISTCISPVTCTPSARPTTCWRR